MVEQRFNNESNEPVRKSCLSVKPEIGYKSVDRQSRKFKDSSVENSLECYKYSSSKPADSEN